MRAIEYHKLWPDGNGPNVLLWESLKMMERESASHLGVPLSHSRKGWRAVSCQRSPGSCETEFGRAESRRACSNRTRRVQSTVGRITHSLALKCISSTRQYSITCEGELAPTLRSCVLLRVPRRPPRFHFLFFLSLEDFAFDEFVAEEPAPELSFVSVSVMFLIFFCALFCWRFTSFW